MDHLNTYEIIEESRELREKFAGLRAEIRAAIAELRRNSAHAHYQLSPSPDGVIAADTPLADVPVRAVRAKYAHLPE
jgi:hypothetical protein